MRRRKSSVQFFYYPKLEIYKVGGGGDLVRVLLCFNVQNVRGQTFQCRSVWQFEGKSVFQSYHKNGRFLILQREKISKRESIVLETSKKKIDIFENFTLRMIHRKMSTSRKMTKSFYVFEHCKQNVSSASRQRSTFYVFSDIAFHSRAVQCVCVCMCLSISVVAFYFVNNPFYWANLLNVVKKLQNHLFDKTHFNLIWG